MTRAELIARLAALHGVKVREADRALAAMLDAIGEGLSKGAQIEIRGFGVFTRKDRPAREMCNPRTGEPVITAAKASVHFKPGAMMRKLVDGDGTAWAALQVKRDDQLRRRDDKAGQLTLFLAPIENSDRPASWVWA